MKFDVRTMREFIFLVPIYSLWKVIPAPAIVL